MDLKRKPAIPVNLRNGLFYCLMNIKAVEFLSHFY